MSYPLNRDRTRNRSEGGNTGNLFTQYTLNLDFVNNFYEEFEYADLDLSLNLDFTNQIYQSE